MVKKSEPESESLMTLNGRAALCAGKDDMSSEDEEINVTSKHKFSQPNLRAALENGMIPDSAMIHLARQARQKARELGNEIYFIFKYCKSVFDLKLYLYRRLHSHGRALTRRSQSRKKANKGRR